MWGSPVTAVTQHDVPALQALIPYLPRLVVEWLDSSAGETYRTVDGTGMFADISGFTDLTERLARKGKVGAEEMGDVLNTIFEQLLGAAYDYGAGLVKWGGDAVLLLFDGEHHAARACRAAHEMQRVIGRIGRIKTSSGLVRLRMSIGVHSGELDFLLVGDHFRDLIVTGPGATLVADMETTANAGEIVVSGATAAALGPYSDLVGEARGHGFLLLNGPDTPRLPARQPVTTEVDLRTAFSVPLSQHLLGGRVENEHRHATVCFIEFSGVDALRASAGMPGVAAAVAQVVTACQRAAEANEVTYLASDIYQDGGKVILISGAPMSAGDDEARILTAARQIMDAELDLPLRIGINSGRLFAGDYGPSYRRVYSICGDCVNLAARLMGKAGHGQIVSSPAVLQRSRTAFETVALEPFAVKGKSDLIEASVVGDIVEQLHRTTGNLPLTGRDREMSIITAALDAARAGHGSTVAVVGELGIGKSRLLEEVAATEDAVVLWSDGDIYATSTPYLPLRRLFRTQLGMNDSTETAIVATALADLIDTTAPHLRPFLPLIGIVVGADFLPTPEVTALDPEIRKETLEAVTSEALGALLTGPTIFIFNDCHFMDRATLDLLGRLATDAPSRPWLVLTSSRPTDGAGDTNPDVIRITLGPLDEGEADALLAVATEHRPLPTRRAQALVERSGGNPLFLRELIAGAGGPGSSDVLPDTVEAMIAARIDRLSPDLRRLLRSASVLGMTIDRSILATVLSVDDHYGQTLDRWDELVEFVVPTADGGLAFANHLTRETAYEGLPFRRRILMHGRAADAIEVRAADQVDDVSDLLSLHSFIGERFQAAWEYSSLAARRARDHYANPNAADFFRRALAAANHLPHLRRSDVADIWEALSDVCMDLDEFNGAEDSLRGARQRAGGDPHRLARLRLKTAVQRQQTARYPDALRWVSRGRAVLEGLDDAVSRQLRAKLAEHYAYVLFYQGRWSLTEEWARRAADEARLARDRHTEARALEIESLAIIYAGRGVDLTSAYASLALYEELGDARGQARAHSALGVQMLSLGRWNDALGHYADSVLAYRGLGRQLDVALQEANQAEILISQGRLDEAEGILADALRIWRGTDAASEMAFGQCQLARIAMARGHFEGALALFTESRRTNFEIGESHEVQLIDSLMAECYLMWGDEDQALQLAERSMRSLPSDDGVPASLPLLQRVRGVVFLNRGDAGEGRVLLLHSLQAARTREARHEIYATLDSLIGGGVARDPDEQAEWMFERAELKRLMDIRLLDSRELSLAASSSAS